MRIPLTESLQLNAQVPRVLRIFIGEGPIPTMITTLPRTTPTHSLLVVPTAHAAEPSATRADGVGAATGEANETNVLDLHVSLTADELAAALAAAAARPSPFEVSVAAARPRGVGSRAYGRHTAIAGRLIEA